MLCHHVAQSQRFTKIFTSELNLMVSLTALPTQTTCNRLNAPLSVIIIVISAVFGHHLVNLTRDPEALRHDHLHEVSSSFASITLLVAPSLFLLLILPLPNFSRCFEKLALRADPLDVLHRVAAWRQAAPLPLFSPGHVHLSLSLQGQTTV